MKFFVYLTIILFLFNACSNMHLRPQLSTEIDYQKDLKMKVKIWDGKDWVNEKTILGMGVIAKSEGYKIKILPPGKADMITVLSCHREWKTPNPKKHGGWFSDKYYEFEIWPTKEHETLKACPFDTGVYEKERGRHAWGLIVIDSEREKLSATVKCNGATTVFGGTSVCQAKKGLIESIHFDRPVLAAFYGQCVLTTPKDRRNWTYIMPEGECSIFFVDEKNPDMIHKHITHGYDSIPIRGAD